MSLAEKAQAVFATLDVQGRGRIHLDDFTTFMSDYGHTDQEIEQLFGRLDIDSNGEIDLSEFVHGYKLFAKSTGESFSDDWKLWNQLDQRDEEDKLKLSKLFSVLEKMQSSVDGAKGESEDSEVYGASMDIEVERDDHSLIIKAPLQPGIASDLLRSLMAGMPLSRTSAECVIKEAIKVLQKEPNCCKIAPPTPESRLTIVGDMHGSLADLNAILTEKGTPSATNRFIFNGDYVDRGPEGVEILLVLFAYKVLHPNHIHLNRGNHEDVLVNQSYGFHKECVRKYDKRLFGDITTAFKNLPLCCIVEGSGQTGIFVVHGGLFTDQMITIQDINNIPRNKYASVIVQSKNPSPHDVMIEEMTWSDPTMDNADGIYPSERGSGIEFGPDITLAWLKKIECNTLVRSHECIEDGCDFIPIKDIAQSGMPNRNRIDYSLYTVFSASNYSDGSNQGAVITYTSLLEKPKVFRFRSSVKPPNHKLTGKNRLRLADMLFRRHYRMLRAFEAADQEKKGQLTESVFVNVLKEVLHLDIKWSAMLPSLLGTLDRKKGQPVDYIAFLSRYSVRKESPSDHQACLSNMYDNFHLLKSTFQLWDEDNNGTVDFKEFETGVNHLNAQIEDESLRLNASELFELVDLDQSGAIDMNEFCEAFRLCRDAIVNEQ